MPKIDLQAAKQEISLTMTIEQAGIVFKKLGKTPMAFCPFHADEKSPSLAVYDDDHFVCFGCGEKGDVITFTQKYYNLSFQDALIHLGITEGAAPGVDWSETRRREQRKRLLDQFEEWREGKIDELSTLIRASHTLLQNIKTLDSFEKYGFIYSALSTWDYQLEILLEGPGFDMLAFCQTERHRWIEKLSN